VFDWGLGGEAGSVAADISRYDPGAMSRVTDIINDLGDDSDDSDSEHGGSASTPRMGGVGISRGESKRKKRGKTNYGPGGIGSALCYRQTIIIVTLVGIIIGASVVIGYTVLSSDPSKIPYSPIIEDNGISEQELLEIAERVIMACSENKLNINMSECQQLCHSKMCCFEEGDYSCEDDESKECAVYAGCDALVEGISFAALDEDVGR